MKLYRILVSMIVFFFILEIKAKPNRNIAHMTINNSV